MKKIKKMLAVWVLVTLVFGIFNVPEKAWGSYDWMETAEELPFGATISGKVDKGKTNYYYLDLPVKLKLSISIHTKGPVRIKDWGICDGKGNWIDAYDTTVYEDWKYIRKDNAYTLEMNAGPYSAGGKYIMFSDIKGEKNSCTYTICVSGSLPDKPAVKSLKKASTQSFKMTWKKISSVTGYQIYRKVGKNGKYIKIGSVKKSINAYTEKELKKGKTYYYKVRAYKTVKIGETEKTFYSKFSSARTIRF